MVKRGLGIEIKLGLIGGCKIAMGVPIVFILVSPFCFLLFSTPQFAFLGKFFYSPKPWKSLKNLEGRGLRGGTRAPVKGKFFSQLGEKPRVPIGLFQGLTAALSSSGCFNSVVLNFVFKISRGIFLGGKTWERNT